MMPQYRLWTVYEAAGTHVRHYIVNTLTHRVHSSWTDYNAAVQTIRDLHRGLARKVRV